MNVPGAPQSGNANLGSAPALPTFQSVMRDIARLTYADHVRLAEALNHSPQVLNDLVGRWANGVTVDVPYWSPGVISADVRVASCGQPAEDVATAMSLTPAYRGYFKESADG